MNFDNVSHIEWLNKIKRELKNDDLSGFNVNVSEVLSINPFFGRKSEKSKGIRQFKNWKHKKTYSSNSLNNKLLLEDLAGGINYVEIQVDQLNTDWEKAFNQVIFEYIDIEFIVPNSDFAKSLVEELNVFEKEFIIKLKDRIIQLDASNYVSQLTDGIKEMLRSLDDCENNDLRVELFNAYRINRKVSPKIIEELALSEAIDVLSQNICKGFGLNPKNINCHADCIAMFDDVERNYIDISMKALIAALANYDAIHIDKASDERPSFHHRISRNIHHLLKEESNLHFSRSAFKGADQVREIRNSIAHEVWSNL